MMRTNIVRVAVELLAVDEGMWCRRCLLPSGVRIWLTMTTGPRMVLRSGVECRDCGGHDIDES